MTGTPAENAAHFKDEAAALSRTAGAGANRRARER